MSEAPRRYRIDLVFGPRTLDPEAVRVAKEVQALYNAEVSRQMEHSVLTLAFSPSGLISDADLLRGYSLDARNLMAAMRIEHNAPTHLKARARAATDRIAAALKVSRAVKP